MAGPVLAFEHRAELLHLDPRLEARRVHLVDRGGEDEIDSRLGGDCVVAPLVPRVALRSAPTPNWVGIDEEAHHDRRAFVACGAEEGPVAVVERAHRRHEPDGAARAARGLREPR